MRKKNLLFAGLLLIGVSAFAQPERTANDAQLVFLQDFEADFETWSNQVVDVIDELYYYNNAQIGTKSNLRIWEVGNKADFNFDNLILRTDSVIELKNGVMLTDDANEIKNHNYDKDQYTILEDQSQDRKDAFEAYGEADKGGQHLFQFISDTCHYAPSWNPSAVQTYSPEYRRNLFVRGLPIEDYTSYRLTFYVKAAKKTQDAFPRLYVDVMRGSYNSEKPISMGLENDPSNYKYKATYTYEKRGWSQKPTDDDIDPFTGEWEKVTLMTCYTNDSIANSFVFIDGYWWADDQYWTWNKNSSTPVPTDYDLRYIVQPDKFFVRLSFSSDNTEFQIDNMSLTKSTIAGVEYSGSKMRVDFGYKTNIAELAYSQSNIGAIEVNNENNEHVIVWGKVGDTWSQIPIASAEYHGDGYMYIFTQDTQNGDPLSFDYYDSVFVTFHNPIDQPELCLKYTGDGSNSANVFPFAWDTEWIQAGKIVPDFYNEVGKRNPYSVSGVYSMKELPPVVQGTEFEDNSFGLSANTSSIWIKFSRQVDFDNLGYNSNKLIATLGDELLTASWETTGADGSGILTLTRTSNSPLSGDKELKLIQLKGIGTPEAAPVTFHYHFGDYTRIDPWTKTSNWRSEINITDNNGLWERPIPTSLAFYYPGEGFYYGNGGNHYIGDSNHNSMGLYKMNDNVKFGDCFFYLRANAYGIDPLTGEERRGNLYTFETLQPGSYSISFAAFGWGSTSRPVTRVLIYPKPDSTSTYWDFYYTDKNEIGIITKTNYQKSYSGYEPLSVDPASGYNDRYLNWEDNTNIFEFPFTITEAGEYVIEWEVTNSSSTSYYGIALGNYTIQETLDELWFEPTNSLNKSVKIAQKYVAKAEQKPALYGGADLNVLISKINADKIGGTFTSTKPSVWAAEKDSLDNAISDYINRIEKVDNLKYAYDGLVDIRDAWKYEEERNIDDYITIAACVDNYASLDYTSLSLESITNLTDEFNALNTNFNNHIAKVEDFKNKKAASEYLLSMYADTYSPLAEYQGVATIYGVYSNFDMIGATMDSLTKVVDKFAKANNTLEAKIASARIYEMQVTALAEFISALDVQIEIPAEIEGLDVLLDNKIDIYMLYAKLALYIAYADGNISQDDAIDVSNIFLTNGQLYTTMTSAMVGPRGLMNNKTTDPNPLDYEFFPGWNYTWTKGNPHLGGTTWGNSNCLATTGNIQNAFVNLDWNSGFIIEQTIAALPAGNYTLGVGYGITPEYNNGGVKILSMDGDTIVNELFYSNANAGGTSRGTPANNFFSFETEGGAKLIINPSCGNNGWNSFDNITLQLNGSVAGFDYNAAIADVEDEIARYITGAPYVPKVHKMYTDNLSANANNTITIPVRMENADAITAFSLDVELPAGISFVSAQLASERSNGHNLSSNATSNWYGGTVVRLAGLSFQNNTFKGNDGTIVNLTVSLSDNLDGEYAIRLNNIEMTVSPTKKYNPASYTGIINVLPIYEPGDVNKDGSITITDAVGIVAFIINSNTQGLSRYAADANQDGNIDVTDAVWVVNQVIHRYYAPSRGGTQSGISSTLSMDDITVAPNMSMPVRIDGMQNEITALQFSMTLPAGTNLKNVITDNDHMVATNKQEDGTYTIVCLSISNNTFSGAGNAALTLELTSDESFSGGEVLLEKAKIVTPDCRQKDIEVVKGKLYSNGQTGIININSDSDSPMYDLQGRAIDNANGIYIRDEKKLMQAK